MAFINNNNLKDFVEHHDLMNNRSIIQFRAIVTISTAQKKITNEEMKISITFDGYDNYGTVSILESQSKLDPKLYPTVFLAKYQKMEHFNNEYLLITDTHKINPTIGKYEIKIIPLTK